MFSVPRFLTTTISEFNDWLLPSSVPGLSYWIVPNWTGDAADERAGVATSEPAPRMPAATRRSVDVDMEPPFQTGGGGYEPTTVVREIAVSVVAGTTTVACAKRQNDVTAGAAGAQCVASR